MNLSVLQAQNASADSASHVAISSTASPGSGSGSAGSGVTTVGAIDVRSHAMMHSMAESVTRWLQSLPTVESLPAVDPLRASDSASSPLDRCLVREVSKGRDAIVLVTQDLTLVRYVRVELWNFRASDFSFYIHAPCQLFIYIIIILYILNFKFRRVKTIHSLVKSSPNNHC